MYHAFTENEDRLDEWTVTPTTFREQLEWLYEHDFYVTPLVDLVNNEISVPPGKHPVVLTFDDSSSGQFRLMKADDGTLTPDPITAVGVMEAFYAEHPDFGRGGLFAVVPNNCFNYDGQETTCEERLEWLSKHDYEVANHTWWHENLKYVSDDLFAMQVGKTKIWLDERVSGEANLSNVLVLPFGEWPSADWQRGAGYRHPGGADRERRVESLAIQRGMVAQVDQPDQYRPGHVGLLDRTDRVWPGNPLHQRWQPGHSDGSQRACRGYFLALGCRMGLGVRDAGDPVRYAG
jgi:peptidoglycan/xylan/chitin deacetylase (PgdA/CDA1 family)